MLEIGVAAAANMIVGVGTLQRRTGMNGECAESVFSSAAAMFRDSSSTCPLCR